MATKKKQQTQVNNQFTGSYVQNLVGNQPVTPVAQVQANVINPTAVGGNSYSSYVNSGAAVTPTAASAVTPTAASAVTPTVAGATAGQYTSSLVQPKTNNANEGGFISKVVNAVTNGGESSDGKGEEGKVEVPDYTSWLETMKSKDESVVEAYDAAINYASKTKEDAYKKAEDQYNIAMREAQANFRANQPTYGAKAEQLLASGLTGGGYSDYLGGKAYEARTDEINAARSQQSYAQYLADQNYEAARYQADQDKFNRQYANDQWKLEYGVQLDNAYKAKVEEVLQGVLNGTYNAAVGEAILKSYAPSGEVSQNIINSLNAQEEKYWWNNNNSITTDFINWVTKMQANKETVNAEGMRRWLKENTNLNDNDIEFWISTYTDENGNYKDPTSFSYKVENNHLWISTDGGKTWNDQGELKEGGQGVVNPDDGGQGGTNPDPGGNNEKKSALESLLSDLESSGRVNAEGIQNIRDQLAGTVISSGVLKKNGGFRQDFSSGDDFRVVIGDKTYRIESGGKVTSGDVTNVAKNVGDGTIFGYGGELYIRSGSDIYKIQARPGLFSGQYGKLWDAVYVEAANKLVKGEDIAKGNADGIQRGNARFKNDAWGNDTSLAAGDNFNIYANGKTYRVTSGGEANDPEISDLITSSGIEDGEVFAYRNQAYLYKGGKIYSVDTRALGLNQEKKLVSMITGNAYNEADSAGNYSETWLDLGSNERETFNAGDSIGLLPWAGSKEYKVVVGAVLGKETAAYNAGKEFADGQAYYYGDDIYVKKGDNAYLIAKNKRQYDKLAEYLNRKETKMDIVASGNVDMPDNYDGIEPGQTRYKINGQTFDFEPVMVHKSINDPIYREAKANGITAGQMFIFNGQPFIMGNNQFSQLRYDGDIGEIQAALNPNKDEEKPSTPDAGQQGAGATGGSNNVTSDAFVAQGGNIIGKDIVLKDDGNNHKTLNINETTYGVSKKLSQNSENRWEKNAIDYATNQRIASGTVFTFKDQSGEYYCYATNDENGNQVFYELTSSPDGWNTFGEKTEAPTTIDDNKNKVSFSDWLKNTGEGISGAFKTAGEKIKGFFGRKEAEEKANANNAENKVDRAYNAGVSGEGLSDKGLEKGDWFTIDIVDIKGGNTTYRVKSGGAVDKKTADGEDTAIYAAAKAAGIYDGEVFAYGDEAYVMRKGNIYSIDTRLLSPKQEEKLVAALGSDIYAPEKNETSNGKSLFAGDTKSNTTSVNNMGTYNANDTIKVSGGDGKSYNVKVASVLNGSSEAYLAAYNNNIAPGTAFIYRGSVYVMGSKDYQNAAVYKLKDNTNARKLAEFLNSDFNANAAAVRTQSGMKVSGSVAVETNGATTKSHNNFWELDNYTSGTGKYVAIQIPDVNGKLDAATKIEIVGKYGTESNAYKAAQNAGLTDNEKYELFLWNGTPYVWLGYSVVELKDDNKLLNYLKNNQKNNEE